MLMNKKKLLFVWLWGLAMFVGLQTKAQYLMTDTCTTPFIAIDTSSSATALGLSDDGESTITIPFNFVFGGVASNTLRVGNNGGVLFNASSGDVSFYNEALSNSTTPGFYPLWDDIGYASGDVYWDVVGTAPNRKVVIEWYNRPHLSVSGSSATFEIVLSESDMSIRFIYQDVVFGDASYDYGASATVGIVTPSGDVFQYSYNTPSLNGINCILFQPISADVSVDEILSPQLTLPCGASGNFDVSVAIRSNGMDTLYNVDVSYSFNNGSWITETIDTVLPFTQDTFTFGSQITIPAPGNYPLSVAVYNSNDEDGFNDTINANVISQPLYSSFPYLDDFEGAQEWIVGGTTTSWQLGYPSDSIINNAFSGNNAWITNLTGNYNNNENGYVESPCFDFTALDTPVVQLAINYNTESCCDGGYIQVSIDDGATWHTILPQSNSENWYTSNSGWRGNSNGWQIASCVLDTFGHKPSVKFRVYFTSDGSESDYEGLAFDNFRVYDKPTNDLIMQTVLSPVSGICCPSEHEHLAVQIYNNGIELQDTFEVSVSIDSGATWTTETYNDTILAGNTLQYTFAQTFDFSTPDTYYVFAVVHNVGDELTFNDTLVTTVVIPAPIDILPYVEDFENTNSNWTVNPTGSYIYTWFRNSGTTSSSNTGPNGDHTTGSGYYMYTEASNGSAGDVAVLQSPCLDFSGAQVLKLSFWYHMYGSNIDRLCVDVHYPTLGWVAVDSIVGQQQSTSSDPWLKKEIILPDSICSVRFRAVEGSSYEGDIAVDDIMIEQAPDYDLALNEILTPIQTCFYSDSEQITVSVANIGLQDVSNFNLSYSIDSGATWTTETYNDTLASLDTLNYTFATIADMSSYGNYNIIVAVSYGQDTLNQNDTIYENINYNQPISAPYAEDFETVVPGVDISVDWDNISSPGGYSWLRNSGSTPSYSTGPNGDHTTGSGYYVYTEANNGNTGDEAMLVSHCFDLSAIQDFAKLSFWYHMYGSNINKLYVEGFDGANWFTLDSLVGQQQTSSTDAWKQKVIFFHSDTLSKLRFRAIRGSGYYGDIAIDDIQIDQASSTDIEAISITVPESSCILGNSETISMTISNTGYDTIPGFNLAYSLDSGATWTSEFVNQQLAPGETFNYTFSTPADFSAEGEYLVYGLASALGDTLNSNDTAYAITSHIPVINTYPYFVDFESGKAYWHDAGTNSSWQFGIPDSTQDTAYSPVNCWATNLSGDYNNDEESYLYTPCFDFSNIASPKMQFAINYHTETYYDESYMEYSTDSGATWQMLGTSGDSAWYNNSDGWEGNSNGWILAYHDLSSLAGQPHVQFRFVMSSDGSGTYSGVMVDNFKIYQDLLPDLAVAYPANGGTVNVCEGFKHPVISVKNVDSVNVVSGTNIGVNYIINNGNVHNETITLSNDLLPGDSIIYQFSDAYYFAANNNYNYKLFISVPNTNYVNDTVIGTYHVQDLTVDIGPDTIWTEQPDTIVLDAGAGFESYLWNDTSTNQTLNVSGIGTYYVQVTDVYGCEASDTVVVALGTGNNLVDGTSEVNIYPNPNTGVFNVELNRGNGNITIDIIDMSGRTIKKISPVNTTSVKIDLQKYGKGLYYVKVTGGDMITVKKVVVN